MWTYTEDSSNHLIVILQQAQPVPELCLQLGVGFSFSDHDQVEIEICETRSFNRLHYIHTDLFTVHVPHAKPSWTNKGKMVTTMNINKDMISYCVEAMSHTGDVTITFSVQPGLVTVRQYVCIVLRALHSKVTWSHLMCSWPLMQWCSLTGSLVHWGSFHTSAFRNEFRLFLAQSSSIVMHFWRKCDFRAIKLALGAVSVHCIPHRLECAACLQHLPAQALEAHVQFIDYGTHVNKALDAFYQGRW